MALKDLLPATQETDAKEYYWALVIEPGWTQAGIWTTKGSKAEIISISPPTAWETDESLIDASDTALSAAVQALPEEAGEPSKTVFGVASSWVSEGQIKSGYLDSIKQICSKLSLEPSGFVVLPEAIAHYIKTQEGSPLSAVVVGIGHEDIEIAVFKLGNLVGNASIARSVSIADDVSEGLARFKNNETFPSRFFLYNGKEAELEEARQSLLKTEWDLLEIKFLHTPKVEIIDSRRKVLAVCLAGASEIADVSSIAPFEEKEKKEKELEEEVENVVTPQETVAPEDVGFVIDEDIAKLRPVKAIDKLAPKEQEEDIKIKKDISDDKVAREEKIERRRKVKLNLVFLKNFSPKAILGKVKSSINLKSKGKPKISLASSMAKKTFIFGGGFLLLVLLGLFIAWWYLPKATVTIFIAPRKIDERVSIFVDPKSTKVDLEKGIIPGEVLRTSVSGEKTKNTTGTKTVGERAKGTVRIQNGTVSDLDIPASTFLTGPNELKFTTDTDVSVSAAVSPSSPGEAEVNVTAVDIGAEYNLVKDEIFSVGNYAKAEVDATATLDFTGGASRQISVVSSEDQEGLEKDLVSELLDKAADMFPEKLSQNQVLIKEALNSEASKRQFSDKVGDEATSVKLSLSLDVSSPAVEKIDLIELAKMVLEDKSPSGFVLRENQIDMDFKFIGEEEGVYELEGVFTANFLPEINTEEIKGNIAGKYSDIAKNYLMDIAGFTRAEISFNPPLPGKLGTLPRVVKNIEIEVAAER